MANDKASFLYKVAKNYALQKERTKAIEHYHKLITFVLQQKKGMNSKYYLELGKLYQEENNFQEAVKYFIHYIELNPTDGPILNEIGICYFNLKKYEEAICYFEKILSMAEIPDVYNNIANCYNYLKNYVLCEKTLMKSYHLQPKNSTRYSLTEIYYLLKEYKKGIYYYLVSDDKNSKHSYNTSFCYLGFKNFKLGFELYEKRLEFNNINQQTKLKDRVDIPEINDWDGKTECKHLLVIYEQGFGDNIMFFRFMIELSKKYPSMRISFFCKKEISNLFNVENYPNIHIIKGVINPKFKIYDYKIYIMSLPHKLGITSISANTDNYISSNRDKLLYWKEKLSGRCIDETDIVSSNNTDELTIENENENGHIPAESMSLDLVINHHESKKFTPLNMKRQPFKIGFVYNGLLQSHFEKYIPLEEFKTLLDLNVELICIQRPVEIENDLNKISWASEIKYFDIDKEEPFIDTVHILQNIDLLVTVDTYIVHLAGVMGVKTLLLLGKISEWRWSTDDKSYWYDSVEIVRMQEYNNLKNVMPLVKKRIQEMIQVETVEDL